MNHWLFQANPERFDLVSAARRGGPSVYAMNQHRAEVVPGDFIYFFVSGAQAGIYATGEVTGSPYRLPVPDEYGEWKVPILYSGLLQHPLLRASLVNDRVLGSWRPFHGLQRTNFPMPSHVAERCALLIERMSARESIATALERESHSGLRDPSPFIAAAAMVRAFDVEDAWLQDLTEIGRSIADRWKFDTVPLSSRRRLTPMAVLRAMHREGLEEERATAQSRLLTSLEGDSRSSTGDDDGRWWDQVGGAEAAARYLDRVEARGEEAATEDLVEVACWVTDTPPDRLRTFQDIIDILRADLAQADTPEPATDRRTSAPSDAADPVDDEAGSYGMNSEMVRLIDEYAVGIAVQEAGARFPDCDITQMPHNNPGHDLKALGRDGRTRYIEVKGTTHQTPVFFLSERERVFSVEHAAAFSLVVVFAIDLAQRSHQVRWHDGEIERAFELMPMQWTARARRTA